MRIFTIGVNRRNKKDCYFDTHDAVWITDDGVKSKLTLEKYFLNYLEKCISQPFEKQTIVLRLTRKQRYLEFHKSQ